MQLRLNNIGFAVALTTVSLGAQTTVSMRASGPAGFVVTGAANSTPLIVQTLAAHNLAAGDKIVIWGVGASVSATCVPSTANGIRKVKAVVDATHFSITDANGGDVAANGAWCDGSRRGVPAGAAAGGKLTDFTLAPQPRGWLDGATGALTRKLALGTANGLTGLVVSGDVATATTSYPHGLASGDKIGVWGSNSTALNHSGAPYRVTVTTGTTFTFPTSGVSDGTYTNANNTCGPSSNQDCLRISQLAYAGNEWWDISKGMTDTWEGNTNWKWLYDGGKRGGFQPFDIMQQMGNGALRSIVDPSDTTMRAVAKYCVTNFERGSGVNWSANEALGSGGNADFNDFASYVAQAGAVCYMAARDYLTPAERQTFADKVYNDIDWTNATPCNKTTNLGSRKVLATGAAQAGSTTTITLAAGDAATTGYYVNNVIEAIVGGASSYGLVRAYDAATKLATVASWSAGAPSAGTAYTIYATVTVSATAPGTATITGYNTTFTTDLAPGDAVTGSNTWQTQVEEAQSYVVGVNSDTSLSVINNGALSASTTTPQIAWYLPKWTTGSCGLRWLQNHWEGALGAQPTWYPPNAADQTSDASQGSAQYPSFASNNQYTRVAGWTALDLALADDDPRAGYDLAFISSIGWDWQLRMLWWYLAGPTKNGAGYGYVRDLEDATNTMFVTKNSVPDYPPMDVTGAWISGPASFLLYDLLPDRRYNLGWLQNIPWPHNYGAEVGDNGLAPQGLILNAVLQMGVFRFQPKSATAGYLKNYLKSFCCAWGHGENTHSAYGLLTVDPRIPEADYTAQPLQRAFTATSAATACAATGWDCPPTWAGNAVVSHTGWTDRSATHLYFGVRGYYGGHDVPEAGTLRIYKVGHLLGPDGSPDGPMPGAGNSGLRNGETNDSMPLFGGTTHLNGGTTDGRRGEASITRWASANRGSWDPSYGDAASRYVYALADLSGMYNGIGAGRVYRHILHFKKPGTEEVVIQFDDIDVTAAPTSIETHLHYPQTGEATSDVGGGSYKEGATTCPGEGGCANLNATRTIVSQEDGSTDAHNPPRTNGVITRIFSPGRITLRDDGTTYSGSFNHAHRVSVCAGASCGAPATVLEAVTVHKIAATLADTTLTAKALDADVKWTGVQTLDKVALFARNGAMPISLSVTTDHAGVAQYLIAGLQDGVTYRVYRNDDDTTVLQAAVARGDNTLYFEAPAGTYSIFPAGLTNLFLRRKIADAHVGAPFQFDLVDSGATGYVWTIAAGALPAGLSLSASGTLSGRPTQAGDTTFTVKAQCVSLPGVMATATMTLHVTPPLPRVNVAAASTQAIVTYGRLGMTAAERCAITVSGQANFSSAIEEVVDRGGPAQRTYVAGASAPLEPGTQYYVRASCNDGASEATAAFQTPPLGHGAAAVPITAAAPPGRAITNLEIQYGPTPALGSAVTTTCADVCRAEIPAPANTVVYLRPLFLRVDSSVAAAGSTRPVVASATGVGQ